MDPGTTTDATNPDTDGDAVIDGAEDTNQNGRVDPGELDPRTPDATGPVGQVCTADKLRPVSIQSESGPDIKLALPPSFTEVTQIRSGAEVKGLVGYDSGSMMSSQMALAATAQSAANALNASAMDWRMAMVTSTVNGFDFDGSARTLSFFGACRPVSEATQVAVSYQYWMDSVKAPNGVVPCADDPYYDPTEPDHCRGPLECSAAGNQCVCKPDCGGTCGTAARCDMTLCACVP